MAVTLFDPLDTLVRLDGEARNASPLPRSADAWRAINQARGERIIGMFAPVDPADLHPEKWEMHPHGDELLYLLEGAIDIVTSINDVTGGDDARDDQIIPLRAGQACIVPPGTWHRLLLREPSRLMFITPAGGTRMRPWRDTP